MGWKFEIVVLSPAEGSHYIHGYHSVGYHNADMSDTSASYILCRYCVVSNDLIQVDLVQKGKPAGASTVLFCPTPIIVKPDESLCGTGSQFGSMKLNCLFSALESCSSPLSPQNPEGNPPLVSLSVWFVLPVSVMLPFSGKNPMGILVQSGRWVTVVDIVIGVQAVVIVALRLTGRPQAGRLRACV